jgi:choice-of-anchor B domain-containing protein
MKKFTLLLASFFQAFQAFSQADLSLLSNLSYNTQLSSIWGYVDDNANEYALVGTKAGVSIVDVTDPSNPVEVKSVSDTSSIWRELKVWNKYAYVTNETGNGLLIIDLSSLPNASGITYTHANPGGMNTGHTIFIDENGIVYVFGTDVAQGALILDISNPTSPSVLGTYTDYYIHDGYVRGDTLWAGAIYNGKCLVLDVSDKSQAVLLAGQTTPGVFTHNTWTTDDGKYLFTTDEVTNSYVTSYDVSDLSNIQELDRYQSTPGSNSIVHNTYVVNSKYLVNAYYKDGVTIVDATYPYNMIEIARYDTYSQGSGDGMTGCWGVYPYLPSGNILASDMINGLFVLKPTYAQACYLEGKVTNKATSSSLYGVSVEILSTSNSATTNLLGEYSNGVAEADSYSVAFNKAGFFPDTVSVILVNGMITTLNVELVEMLTYTVNVTVEDENGNELENASVSIQNSDFNFGGETDTSGLYQDTAVYGDEYDIIIGKWGYQTECLSAQDIPTTSTFNISLKKGYYDDFSLDFGWAESGTSSSGAWERGEPIGTEYNNAGDSNPEYDESGDCSDECYVTGNAGGTSSNDDVDNGYTMLTSPVFDLSSYVDPYISYSRWFFNNGGSGNPNDTLIIKISDGVNAVALENVTKNNTQQSTWVEKSFKISDYISPGTNMQLMLYTADQSNSGHLVEAGFDLFQIIDSAVTGVNQKPEENILIHISVLENTLYLQYAFNSQTALNNAAVIVTNAVGQQIINYPLNIKEANISISEKLSAGIYFVSLVNNNVNCITKKIVLIR